MAVMRCVELIARCVAEDGTVRYVPLDVSSSEMSQDMRVRMILDMIEINAKGPATNLGILL